MIYIKKKFHKNIEKTPFKINKVFSHYFSGGLEVDGKWRGRTFIYFPKRITDDVIVSGDERAKPQGKEEMQLRERVWNKADKRMEFHKFKDATNRDFYKAYKKVYDVEITLGWDVVIPLWDGKQEVETTVSSGETVVLSEFPASRLRQLLELIESDSKIEKIEGVDKTGKPVKSLPFDWEDSVKSDIEGRFISFRVSGEGMDTRYLFKEVAPFHIEVNEVADEPFGSEVTADDFFK